jgi:chemotaxis protein CheX
MKKYLLEKTETYNLLKLGDVLTFNENREFELDIESFLLGAQHPFIVDFSVVETLSKDWVRSLMRLQLGLKKKHQMMKLVSVSPNIFSFLKKEGIDTAFQIAPTLKEALQDLGLGTKRSLDTEFINPFLDATLHVLDIQAQIKSKPGKLCLKKNEKEFQSDISGIIGIVSETFNGSVVISFPEKTFLKVMSSMLGDNFTEINKDILDGAGEITNMIFGQAKISLNEKGYGIKTALPSVVHGKSHILTAQTKGSIVVIPFESTAGNFHVEICLSN